MLYFGDVVFVQNPEVDYKVKVIDNDIVVVLGIDVDDIVSGVVSVVVGGDVVVSVVTMFFFVNVVFVQLPEVDNTVKMYVTELVCDVIVVIVVLVCFFGILLLA